MAIRLNEQVYTSDGYVAGTVDKVILEVSSGEVEKVLIREGTLLPHDVEVALADIHEDHEGKLRLTLDSTQLHHLPRFHEAGYSTPPPDVALAVDYDRERVLFPYGWVGGPITGQPPAIPTASDLPPEVVESLNEADVQEALIEAGSAIRSHDGDKVGELARLTFTEDEGRLASLVIRQGFLFPKEHELPGNLVASVNSGEIFLKLTRAEVAKLIQ
jgi:sporulation protein YlmC with PRC-barrel domain